MDTLKAGKLTDEVTDTLASVAKELSEKYKGSKLPILRSIVIGTISNLKAFFNGQYSSNYFVFKKIQEI